MRSLSPGRLRRLVTLALVGHVVVISASADAEPSLPVPLAVEAGTPIHVYLTRRLAYRLGQPVEAKVAAPVYVFDRIVIPPQTKVEGKIVALEAVPRLVRVMTMLRGDFTPLKLAYVRFESLTLADGRAVSLNTSSSLGLASYYVPPRPPKHPERAASVKPVAKPSRTDPDGVTEYRNTAAAQMRMLAKQQVRSQINARTQGFLDFVHAPGKREWLETLLWSRLPYHPQWYRTGTRFDALLQSPLSLGTIQVPKASLRQITLRPTPDLNALVRMTNTFSSDRAQVNDPVRGILSAPLLGPGNVLVLPQGTELVGRVTLARPARLFHRGGKLRFSFDRIEPAPVIAAALAEPRPERIQTQLTGLEQRAHTVLVDQEGTARAAESKTRLLRPIVAGLIAAKSLDNDEGRQTAQVGATGNSFGRSLGGFSGFGLFGAALAQGPPQIGAALGFYGLAWSFYSAVVARGQDVTFQKDAEISIRFGAPRHGGRAGSR